MNCHRDAQLTPVVGTPVEIPSAGQALRFAQDDARDGEFGIRIIRNATQMMRLPDRERVSRGGRYCLSAGISIAGVLPLNLSRRDRNRADLSSDK